MESSESFASLVRIFAHAIEKAAYSVTFDPARGKDRADVLRSLLNSSMAITVDTETRAWAEQMLALYDRRSVDPDSSPLLYDHKEQPPLDKQDFLRFLRERRSVRHFTARQLTIHDIEIALEAMRCAPTSCHRQAVKAFLTVDPQVAFRAHGCCVGRSGFSHNIPAFVSFCADSNAYSYPEESALPFVDGAICAAFFVLGCHACSLGATMMAWSQGHGERERELRKVLQIPPHYLVVVNCAVGEPAGISPSNPRKAMAEWYKVVK